MRRANLRIFASKFMKPYIKMLIATVYQLGFWVDDFSYNFKSKYPPILLKKTHIAVYRNPLCYDKSRTWLTVYVAL